jgi:TldD protein
MLERSLVEEVLRAALARGGRFAEVFAEERSGVSIRLDDGRIEELVTGDDRGAGVRVVHGDASAYAFSNRLDRDALLEAARAASAAVRDATPQERTIDLRATPAAVTHRAERPAGAVAKDRKVGWVREADDAARSLSAEVRQVVVGYGDSVQPCWSRHRTAGGCRRSVPASAWSCRSWRRATG